jgi:hypothetical protein
MFAATKTRLDFWQGLDRVFCANRQPEHGRRIAPALAYHVCRWHLLSIIKPPPESAVAAAIVQNVCRFGLGFACHRQSELNSVTAA